MIQIILLSILFISAIIISLSWANNLQIKGYYKKVASYLGNSEIIYPSLFYYGKIRGLYRERNIEWRCFISWSGFYWGSMVIEARMRINKIPQYKSSITLSPGIFLKDGWLVYLKPQPFVLKETNIIELLERLYLEVKEYEQGMIVQCLKCGEQINENLNKCPKCGWTWNA